MIKFEKIPADILSNVPMAKDMLEQNANVVFAYLFGGLARGKVKPLSDVDVAVYRNMLARLALF